MKPHMSRVFVYITCVATLLSALLCGGCSTPGPDGPTDSYGIDFTMPPGSDANGAIIFFIDGVNAERFRRMLEANELPAFGKYFADRGLYCPRALAGVPSVTLANETSLVTGVFPGRHGIIGTRWFDRNRLVWRNYATIAQKNMVDEDYTATNIYEQFPDRDTFSLFYQVHRGATEFVENRITGAVTYVFGMYDLTDRITLDQFHLVAEAARRHWQFPAVTVCYQLMPDFQAYRRGETSPEYAKAILHADRQIGRVLGDMDRAGVLDKLTIVLISDHGHGDVKRHFVIERFLKDQARLDVAGGKLYETSDFNERMERFGQLNAVTAGCGDRYWSISLRRPLRDANGEFTGFDSWLARPSAADLRNYPARTDGKGGDIDLVSALLAQEAVDAVAFRCGDNCVHVGRKDGEVEFRAQGAGISYRVVSGSNPLGWEGKLPPEALAGKPLTSRQWLDATADVEFPDLPGQIVAYFGDRRAADIAVFAAPGWDFHDENLAGHGGLRRFEMHVPLLMAGPGIPAKTTVKTARAVDIMPTLLKLMGRPIPPGLDGQPIEMPTHSTTPSPAPTE